MTESTCQGERAETVCSSLTAQHITSEIQYIHHILSLQSIIAIKHSLPRCTEKLTLMPKTSVPKRLPLIQKSARFSHRSNDSSPVLSAPYCTHHPAALPTRSPWHSPYRPSVSTPLSNSASFPFPFISAYVKIESAVLRTTGIPTISLFPDLNLIFCCLARFQSWAAR